MNVHAVTTQPGRHRVASTPRPASFPLAAFALTLAVGACTRPSPSPDDTARAGSRLSFGATPAQALEGATSSFPAQSTPNLALHATLADDSHEGQTLVLRGADASGATVWSYPHLQHGRSFDAVVPVFGSAAVRAGGTFHFSVTAADGSSLADGAVTFTSTQSATARAR